MAASLLAVKGLLENPASSQEIDAPCVVDSSSIVPAPNPQDLPKSDWLTELMDDGEEDLPLLVLEERPTMVDDDLIVEKEPSDLVALQVLDENHIAHQLFEVMTTRTVDKKDEGLDESPKQINEIIQLRSPPVGNSSSDLLLIRELGSVHVEINEGDELLCFDPGGEELVTDYVSGSCAVELLLHVSIADAFLLILEDKDPSRRKYCDRNEVTPTRDVLFDLFELQRVSYPRIAEKWIEIVVSAHDELIDILKKKVLLMSRTTYLDDLGNHLCAIIIGRLTSTEANNSAQLSFDPGGKQFVLGNRDIFLSIKSREALYVCVSKKTLLFSSHEGVSNANSRVQEYDYKLRFGGCCVHHFAQDNPPAELPELPFDPGGVMTVRLEYVGNFLNSIMVALENPSMVQTAAVFVRMSPSLQESLDPREEEIRVAIEFFLEGLQFDDVPFIYFAPTKFSYASCIPIDYTKPPVEAFACAVINAHGPQARFDLKGEWVLLASMLGIWKGSGVMVLASSCSLLTSWFVEMGIYVGTINFDPGRGALVVCGTLNLFSFHQLVFYPGIISKRAWSLESDFVNSELAQELQSTDNAKGSASSPAFEMVKITNSSTSWRLDSPKLLSEEDLLFFFTTHGVNPPYGYTPELSTGSLANCFDEGHHTPYPTGFPTVRLINDEEVTNKLPQNLVPYCLKHMHAGIQEELKRSLLTLLHLITNFMKIKSLVVAPAVCDDLVDEGTVVYVYDPRGQSSLHLIIEDNDLLKNGDL